jgi:hypothetical protein
LPVCAGDSSAVRYSPPAWTAGQNERCLFHNAGGTLKMKTVILFERGIDGLASIFGEWRNWPNQAIAHVHNNSDFRAQTLTYFTGPFFAGFTRAFRADNYRKLIRSYCGWNIKIVAHSEGTATVLQAIKGMGLPVISELHLLNGACDSNFETNGLNDALYMRRVGKVFCYRAGKDMAMKIENTLLGKFFFQMKESDKPLGLVGPQKVRSSVSEFWAEVIWPEYGHSTCWDRNHFKKTMAYFVTHEPS